MPATVNAGLDAGLAAVDTMPIYAQPVKKAAGPSAAPALPRKSAGPSAGPSAAPALPKPDYEVAPPPVSAASAVSMHAPPRLMPKVAQGAPGGAIAGAPDVPAIDWWDKAGTATLEHAGVPAQGATDGVTPQYLPLADQQRVVAPGAYRLPPPSRGPDGKPLYAVPGAFCPATAVHDVHSLCELHGEPGMILPPPETFAIRFVEENESTVPLNTVARARGPGGDVQYELPQAPGRQPAPPVPRINNPYATPRMPDPSPYAAPARASNHAAAPAKAIYPVPADMVAPGPMHNLRSLSELQNEQSMAPPPGSIRFVAEQDATLPMSRLETLPQQGGAPPHGVEVQYELPQSQSLGRPQRDTTHYATPVHAPARAASEGLYPVPADQAATIVHDMLSLSELDRSGGDFVVPLPPSSLRFSAEQEATASVVGKIETLPQRQQVTPPRDDVLPPKLMPRLSGAGQPANTPPMPSNHTEEMFSIPAFRQTAQADKAKRDVRKRPTGARRRSLEATPITGLQWNVASADQAESLLADQLDHNQPDAMYYLVRPGPARGCYVISLLARGDFDHVALEPDPAIGQIIADTVKTLCQQIGTRPIPVASPIASVAADTEC